MTGTAISLGMDGVSKPPPEPILSHNRMSPLRRNALLNQGNLLHQPPHLHLGAHLDGEPLLHEDVQGRPAQLTPKKPGLLLMSASAILFDLDVHLHQELHFNHESHLLQGAHLHQDGQSHILQHEPKPKASLRVSERTWESRRIKEEMQGIVSPTPLELHKVSPRSADENQELTCWF